MSLQIQTHYCNTPPLVLATQKSFQLDNTKESKLKTISLNTTKLATLGICAGGAATFIGVAKNFAKGNLPLYIIISVASTITYTALDFWAYKKWMEFSNAAPIDIPLNKYPFSSKLKLISLKIATLFGGAISMIPLAYVAYKDNDNSYIALFLLLAAASSIPAYSLLLTLNSNSIPRKLNSIDSKLEKSKKNLCAQLNKKGFYFLRQSRVDQISFLNRLSNINNYKGESQLSKILKDLFLTQSESTQKTSRTRQIGSFGSQVFGAASAIARLALYGTISYHAGSLLSNSDEEDSTESMTIGITACTLVIASTAYINLKVLTNMAKRTYDSTVDFFQCKRTNTLASILHPYASFLKIPISFICASLTVAPMLQFTDEYLPGIIPEEFSIVDKILFGAATLLLYGNALRDLSDQLLANPIFTSKEGKQLIKLHAGIKILEDTINKSSFINIATFLNVLPIDVFDQITKSIAISKSEIEEYIYNNKSDSEESIYKNIEESEYSLTSDEENIPLK